MNKKLYMVDVTAVVESDTEEIDIQYFTADGEKLKAKDIAWWHVEELDKL